MISDFYVTLPSNASMQYFPRNTQSSYRTKLLSPLMLSGEWEVGISEIFIPRNWFNIADHNNDYMINIHTAKTVVVDTVEHIITCIYKNVDTVENFITRLNGEMRKAFDDDVGVTCILDIEAQNVTLHIEHGFEVHISKSQAPKLLFMLHLPAEDIVIKETTVMRFRPTTDTHEQTFIIVNKNPTNVKKHAIPLYPVRKEGEIFNNNDTFISVISRNIERLNLQKYAMFTFDTEVDELEIKVADYAELHLTEERSRSMLRILNHHGDLIVRGTRKFSINSHMTIRPGDYADLLVKEYSTITKREKETIQLFLNVGMYKTAESLFNEFQHIQLKQLPDHKVILDIPKSCSVSFGQGLADMLGFETRDFTSGSYISKYPLELDAGITEIFVYSDLIESHHVGDSYVPLLRIIPCLNEKNDQIVKHYETPLYFPLRKNFVDTVEIELKTVMGRNIIFTGGKTFVILSFRRKKPIN